MFNAQEEKELRALLVAQGLDKEFRVVGRMAGDGSDRRFCRLSAGGVSLLAVLPNLDHPQGMAEAVAARDLGNHFRQQGVAVPRIYGFAPASGLILFEDLGDRKLHDLVRQEGVSAPVVARYYRQAVSALAHLQTEARHGFDPAWCYDTPRYDAELMLARESGYFQKALCEEFLGLTVPGGLSAEFVRLAGRAAREPADYVLHRDFQSRNLMVHADGIRIIDYQGARLGPLGYDLASLLIDPYVGLPDALRQQVFSWYLDALAGHIPLDRARFIEGYYYMALQRNLQILGAFAFLSKNRGKAFFRQFIVPASRTLYEHLTAPQGRDFPLLRGVVEQVGNSLQL
ncbi:aminoglycoside phosphotransferase family protein [Thiovibrio sp. JS02]